jgi:hypothetical protein
MGRAVVGSGLTVLLALASAALADEAAEDRAAALTAVRQAASVRDLAGLKASLTAAASMKGEERFDAELARLDELGEYIVKFWQAVERGCQSLESVNELEVGEQRVAVVEYANGRLVLRVAGQNKAYTQKDMPPKLGLTLAGLVLKDDAAQNKVFFGAMLALDAKGDRKLARQYWDEAAAAGIDLKRLLPELEVPLPAPPVEIPAMNPVLRNLLSERNWSLRERSEKGWVKGALERVAEQNAEGRLEVQIPANAESSRQLLAKRPISGDFVCRMIVVNSDKSNTVGLFASGFDDEGLSAPLSKGTSLVELSRQQGKLSCKLNGAEVELAPIGKPAARLSGNVGLQLAPGSKITIAAVEFAAR